MEACSMIKGPKNNPDPPLNSHSTPQLELEMMMVMPRVSYSYTSLRDIMPLLPHPSNYSASWNEIPIKNPLLKQAALAYLQPMSSPSEVPNNKGFFHNFIDNCFGWLCGGVFNTLFNAFVGFFCGRRRITNVEEEDQRHEDHDDDDEGEEEEDKVD